MKIEILIVDNINETCTGMTCFEADNVIWNALKDHEAVQGIVIIDGQVVKFSFSPYFRDGDIFSNNAEHRTIVKYFVPIYLVTLLRSGVTTYLKDYAKNNL